MSTDDDHNLTANLGLTQTDDLELANQKSVYLSQSAHERGPSQKGQPDGVREAINTQDSNNSLPKQVLLDLGNRNALTSEAKPLLEPIASMKEDGTDS